MLILYWILFPTIIEKVNLEAARIQLQTTQNDDTKLAYKQLANDETE